MLVFKDASAQRAAALALEASQERLRLALEVAELGTWDLDLTTGKLLWDSQNYRIMGFAPGAPVDRDTVRKLVIPQDMEALDRAIERARQDRKPFVLDYRINRASDGSEALDLGHGPLHVRRGGQSGADRRPRERHH